MTERIFEVCPDADDRMEIVGVREYVIRCRDCKYCSNESVYTPQFYCVSPHWNKPAYAVETDSNGFCAWAEWREA